MNKEELIQKLKEAKKHDTESAHSTADDLLIEYINDEEIAQAYHDVQKWYA